MVAITVVLRILDLEAGRLVVCILGFPATPIDDDMDLGRPFVAEMLEAPSAIFCGSELYAVFLIAFLSSRMHKK